GGLRGAPESGLAHDGRGHGIAEPEGMIAAEQDSIFADDLHEIGERRRKLHQGVVVEPAQVSARKRGPVGTGFGPWHGPAVEAADVIRQEAPTLDQHDLQWRGTDTPSRPREGSPPPARP